MHQEPDATLTPADSFADLPWFSASWQNLSWTEWIPFSATKAEFKEIPNEPGIYRIRPAGKDFLMYISETNRTLHQRINELRQNLRRTDLMPWNDPDISAPALWAWREAEGYGFECSAVPLDASAGGRRAMENFLISRYRQEYGASPVCSFGHFHPRYRRSTNRSEGRRGGLLREDQKDNPAGLPGLPPLPETGRPGDPAWMGISWSSSQALTPENVKTVPPGSGLFILSESASEEILYIGQAVDCKERLLDQCRRERAGHEILFTYHIPEKSLLPHQLREWECDLLGNYFSMTKKAPALQYPAHGQ
jgi:hypothetical protein